MNNYRFPSKPVKYSKSGKASVFAPVKGSVTVEAAMAVPIFFFAVICLFYLMEITAVQTAVRCGLQYAGKEAAQEGYIKKAISPAEIESDVVNAIGAGRLERSIVVGGSGGIDCSGSKMSARTGIAELQAVYHVRVPVPMFGIPPITYKEHMRVKTWSGYERGGLAEDNETVYITETGVVYHKDYHCTYLDLSIRMVPASQIETLRNKSGGKYHACERCKNGGGGVYITNYGDRYHSSLSCSGLKRTVYAVPLSEAVGKGACSKCGR